MARNKFLTIEVEGSDGEGMLFRLSSPERKDDFFWIPLPKGNIPPKKGAKLRVYWDDFEEA
jgi:hypothetical protein